MIAAEKENISVRMFADSDYPMLCTWWAKWNFPIPALDVLPSTGYIVDESAAVFIYLTNSPVAWMEWLVSDPECDKELRSAAVDVAIDHAICQAKLTGSKVFFTTSNRPAVSSRLEQHGFVKDIDTTQFFRRL